MTSAPPDLDVLTFGCRLNIAESEAIRAKAEAAGLRNVVIVNTCAVTAEAERQAGQAIRRLKRENPDVKIIVTGCSSQIDPEKYAAMREVDGIVGNGEKLNVASYACLDKASAIQDMPKPGDVDLSFAVHQSPDLQRAFVQVQNGCDNACTFCVIPFGRGASRSVSFETIAAQVRACVAKGYNEVVLTGVDIASYGRDLPGQPTLGYMVKHVLSRVPELQRLRLSSLDPAALDEDLWEVLSENPRLMPHLHLSVQSGDDMVLKRMKRRHSRADIFTLVDRARRARPDIVFGADFIAGFPTETEAMFANTYKLVEECGLTWLHVFPYSARKGTPAAKMPQVHGKARKERAERLRALGEAAARRHYDALQGKTLGILVENNGMGCTPQFAKLRIDGQAPVGRIVDVRCVRDADGSTIAKFDG